MPINSVTIAGNLTRDMEVRTTSSGYPIGNMTVAVNERQKQGNEYVDYANFVDVTLFGERANKLAQYLTKGTKVTVSGRLHQERFETKNGEKRNRMVVYANDIEFMSRNESRSNGSYQQTATPDFYEEDIPF